MKRIAIALSALCLLAVGGLVARPLLDASPAHAQVGKPETKADEIGRYSIIAAQGSTLYFLDTKTGQLWRHTPDETPIKWKPYPPPASAR
ncbi:MAG TPA: hypothetical protein VM490_03535 [Armatimonadaceae bacterium]|nr:hypothetical protein [Armatimonadaceae bacterium]